MHASASSAPRTIHLSPTDNVIVAVDTIDKGVTVHGVTAIDRVPRGHKMTIKPLALDEPVIKFGQIIGFVSKAVVPGTWLHEHNVGMRDFERDYCFAGDISGVSACQWQGRHTELYRYSDIGELFGIRSALHGAGNRAVGHFEGLPPY